MHVVVVGAGVVGASIAVELARRGAAVTLVDKSAPGSGTSSTSYAWVNANNKNPQGYFDLNLAGLRAHHELSNAHQGNWLGTSGHLEFATDEAHRSELRARAERLGRRNYPVEEVDVSRARELVPDLLVPEDCDTLMFFPGEAHCFPALYLAFMLRQARDLGVTLVSGVGVEGLSPHGDAARVTLGDGSQLIADRVVSAVGRWTRELVSLAGVRFQMAEFEEPGDLTVGYLAITNPLPASLPRIVTSPWLNLRPEGGGRLMLQALDLDATADPSDVPGPASGVAKEFTARLQAVLDHTSGASISQLHVGQRAMPADGYTAVGPVPAQPWLYVVATHSGVTLAPLLGGGVAAELFGATEPLFSEFRPDRLVGDLAVSAPATPRKPGEQ